MSYRDRDRGDRDRRGGDRDGGRRPPDTDDMISLKVDNLTYKTTPESLKRGFDRYGAVGDIYIPRDPYTQDSRGFAFVRYYEQRDADDAIEAMDGQMLDGRPLRVQLARHARPAPAGFRRGGGGPPRRRRSYSRSRSRSRGRGRRHRSRSDSKSRSRSAESDKKARGSHRRDNKDRSRSKSPAGDKRSGDRGGKGNGKKSASRSRSPDD